MAILLNYRKGNSRLKEGLEGIGHVVAENIWNVEQIKELKVEAVVFEFKQIFKRVLTFLNLALRLKKEGIPVITWNLDSPWNMGISLWKINLLLKSSILDIYAVHSLQDTEHIKGPMVLYLPNAAPVSQYSLKDNTLQDLRRQEFYRWDVSFLGNIDFARYPEHRARVDFLRRLGGRLKEKGVNFLFLDGKNLSAEEQVDIIQRSKINLSCMSAADSNGSKSWGLPERCYGVPACGGFLLMDERIHVRDDFSPDEAATYKDLEDCLRKITYYLNNHEERRRIAENAYKRVIRDHTYQKRAERLVDAIHGLTG